MRITMIRILILFGVLSLNACIVIDGEFVESWEDDNRNNSHWDSYKSREKYNKHYISNMSLGTSSEHIINDLGQADFSESFQKDNKEILILFYRTHRIHQDGDTSKDECTPLIFENKQLSGWGEGNYQSIR